MFVDGELADVVPYFELFAAAALETLYPDRDPADCEIVAPEIPYPHSISRLSKACGLSQVEYEMTVKLMSDVPMLWTVMDAHPVAITGELVAYRFPTKAVGGSQIWKDPLVQTLKWVRDHYGIQYPVIRLLPDEWQEVSSV